MNGYTEQTKTGEEATAPKGKIQRMCVNQNLFGIEYVVVAIFVTEKMEDLVIVCICKTQDFENVLRFKMVLLQYRDIDIYNIEQVVKAEKFVWNCRANSTLALWTPRYITDTYYY